MFNEWKDIPTAVLTTPMGFTGDGIEWERSILKELNKDESKEITDVCIDHLVVESICSPLIAGLFILFNGYVF